MASTTTRLQTEVWLVGQPEPCLPHNVLPTSGQIWRTVYYNHNILHKTIPESLKATSEDLVSIWNCARIPTAFQPNIVSKMKALIEDYNLLKKNKARKSQTQRNREQEFTEQMGKLFDISHKQAKELIRIAEDRIFLEDQRGPRQMKMAGIDKKLAEQEERTLLRKVMEEKRTKKEEKRKQESLTSSVAGSDVYEGLADRLNTNSKKDTEGEEDTEEECDKFDNDYEIEIPIYHRKQLDEAFGESSTNEDKKPRLLEKILSYPDVASTLDRINLSDRKFVLLAAAIAKANDEDLSTAPLSHSTVHRKRSSHRSAIASDIRQEFMLTEKAALVVHWDGKIMKDTTNHEDPKSTADRLAVSVTGVEIEKILGIVKLTSVLLRPVQPSSY